MNDRAAVFMEAGNKLKQVCLSNSMIGDMTQDILHKVIEDIKKSPERPANNWTSSLISSIVVNFTSVGHIKEIHEHACSLLSNSTHDNNVRQT